MAQGRLQAGLGKASITPKQLCGFRGVHRDIWARALVLSDGRTSLGLVLADQAAFNREQVGEVRRRVQTRCGLPADNLMVACTHTHSVPAIVFRDVVTKYPQYLETVIEGLAASVCQAVENLQPARLGIGRVKTEDIAVNRRIKMIDGYVFTSRYAVPSTWYLSPDIIQGYGPVDPWLTTWRIEDLEGNMIGAVGNFAGHPISGLRSKYISGDSFGHAENLLEQVYPGAVTMLTNGALGNIIARGQLPERGPRFDSQAEQMGEMIGGYWITALAGAQSSVGDHLAVSRREIELPLRDEYVELLRRAPTVTLPLRGEQPMITEPDVFDAMEGLLSVDALVSPDVRTRGLEARTHRTEVQAFRINDAVWVSMPGEVFVELQLTIKEKSQISNTIVVGLANDYPGYIPTREAFSELGYEVSECPGWSNLTQDASGILTMTALELIRDLRQKGHD